MLSVERPHWLVAVANLLVVIHVFGSYQVCSAWPAWMAFIDSTIAEVCNIQVCSTNALARWMCCGMPYATSGFMRCIPTKRTEFCQSYASLCF